MPVGAIGIESVNSPKITSISAFLESAFRCSDIINATTAESSTHLYDKNTSCANRFPWRNEKSTKVVNEFSKVVNEFSAGTGLDLLRYQYNAGV